MICYNANMSETADEISLESPSKEVATVMIAEDHPLVREALRTLVMSQKDLKVVGEAADGEEAVSLAVRLRPDIIVMDISMPKLNGLIATRRIKDQCPDINVLVLTVHSDSEHVMGIFDAGASGYLTKSVFGNEVLTAIRSVIAGDSVLSKTILKQILQIKFQQFNQPQNANVVDNLTSREIEILKLAARGLSNKDIALKLNLRLQTIKGYLVIIYSRLRVKSRTEAVITGLRTGILTIRDLE